MKEIETGEKNQKQEKAGVSNNDPKKEADEVKPGQIETGDKNIDKTVVKEGKAQIEKGKELN